MPPALVEKSVGKNDREDGPDREKVRAVDAAFAQIEKQFGKGSIMRLGQKGPIQPIDSIPTGSISIDYALGVGGVPRGRVIEIFGPESSGKTTLALQVIAEAQKLGGMAAFVDAEHALDAAYAVKLGVDLDNLLVSQPDNGEQALEIVEVLIRSGAVDVAGPPQAHRHRVEIQNQPHLHQPAPREDRRDVRQPRNDDRRTRAQV